MRRTTIVIAVAGWALSLAACGSRDASDEGETDKVDVGAARAESERATGKSEAPDEKKPGAGVATDGPRPVTLGKEKLAGMREERDEHYVKVSEEVKALTLKALTTYHRLFDSPGVDPELQKKTADTITLDIAGMRAPTKVDTRTLHAHATLEEINEFKRRGLEAIKDAGLSTVEVTQDA